MEVVMQKSGFGQVYGGTGVKGPAQCPPLPIVKHMHHHRVSISLDRIHHRPPARPAQRREQKAAYPPRKRLQEKQNLKA